MIQQALQALADELNAYFKQVFDLPESQPKALVTAFVGPDGNALTDALNKVCLMLVNVEQETTLRNGTAGRPTAAAGSGALETTRVNPAIRLNLRVLVAANFQDYAEALKFLSATLTFFQRKNVLTAQNAPALDRQLDKLLLELETLTTHEWSNRWGMLGSKLLPAVVYKVRMLTLQEMAGGQRLPVIGAIDPQTA